MVRRLLLLAVLPVVCAYAAPTCNAGWPSYSFSNSAIPNAGTARHLGNTYRAGYTAQLDASASTSGDASGLTYTWTQVAPIVSDLSQQAGAVFSDIHAQKPTVTGLVAGPFDLQLTVTDIGDGLSASCIISNGVVSTDAAGTVTYANTALGNGADKIIGKQVAYGKNPWPYYDQANMESVLTLAATYDLNSTGSPANYPVWWNTAATGTMSIASAGGYEYYNVTGSGTNFQATFCGGGTGWDGNTRFILWYKTGRTVGGQPETGRLRMEPSSCSSATAMVAHVPYYGSGWMDGYEPTVVAALSQQTGLSFTVQTQGYSWMDSNKPPYYDPGQAFYSLYLRSGIDTYLWWGRKWVDNYWTWPSLDRGMAFLTKQWPVSQNWTGSVFLNIGGLVLRALDTGDGHAEMWTGLTNLYYTAGNLESGAHPTWEPNGNDARISAANLLVLAYAAMFDQGPTQFSPTTVRGDVDAATFFPGLTSSMSWQQFARSNIKYALCQTSGTCNPVYSRTYYSAWRDPVQKAWLHFSAARMSYDASVSWSGAKVHLTNGSTTVTCPSGNCGFQSVDFSHKFDQDNGGAICASGTACTHAPIVFCAGDGSNSGTCDNRAYCHGATGCGWNSGSSVPILDTPYAGPTGDYNWLLATCRTEQANCTTAGSLDLSAGQLGLGWGQDSFMEGLMAFAFQQASTACAMGQPGCGNTEATIAGGYAKDAADWLYNYGQTESLYGLSYLAGYPACIGGQSLPVKVPNSNIACLAQSPNPIVLREIMGDAAKGLFLAYQAHPSAGVKTMLDNWYAGMWAKPGIGTPPVASPDGQYDSQFDGTLSGCTTSASFPPFNATECGWWLYSASLSGTATGSQKAISQHFGISDQATWPALRLAGTSTITTTPKPTVLPTPLYAVLEQALNGAPFVQVGNGEPTGAVACNLVGLDLYYDQTSQVWYACTATGTPGSWSMMITANPTPAASSSCGSLTGASGCLEVMISGIRRYVPIY